MNLFLRGNTLDRVAKEVFDESNRIRACDVSKLRIYSPFRRSGCFVQIQSGHVHLPRVGFAPVDGQYIPESPGDGPPHPAKKFDIGYQSDRRSFPEKMQNSARTRVH